MPDDSHDLEDLTLLAARRLNRQTENGRWALRNLEEAIAEWFGVECDLRPDSKPLRNLLPDEREAACDADIVSFSAGRYTTYQAVMPMPMTLAEIHDWAEKREDPNLRRTQGSRGSNRERHWFTSSNLAESQRAARRLGRLVDGEPGNDGDARQGMQNIGPDRLVWDDQEEDWLLVEELERKMRQAGDSESTIEKYVVGLRRLLDVAASRAWIAKTEAHHPGKDLPDRWADVHENWRAEITGEVNSASRKVAELLAAARRLGCEEDRDPAEAPWGEIIEHLESEWRANNVDSQERTITRRAYRMLRKAGALSGPGWDGRKRRRERATSLIPSGDRDDAAELYGRERGQEGVAAAITGEPLDWPGEWQQYPALVNGEEPDRRYGLRIYMLMRSAKQADLVTELNLPKRHPETGKRKGRLRSGSFKNHLYALSQAAGFLADRHGVDWAQNDLRTLFRQDLLDEYASFLEEETGASVHTRVLRLGWFAYIARTLGHVADDRGDEELAHQFWEAFELLDGEGVGGRPSLCGQLWAHIEESGSTRLERMQRKARLVENTWTRQQSKADFAHDQMTRLAGHALELFVRDFGSLPDQEEAIATPGEFPYQVEGARLPLDRSWAKRLRNLVLWHDQLSVPYRSTTIIELDRVDREVGYGWTSAQGKVHGWKRKNPNTTWHKPNYKTDYPIRLLKLFLMEGGGRDLLLTRPDGTRWRPTDGEGLRDTKEAYRKPEEEDGRTAVPREPLYPQRLGESDYARLGPKPLANAIRGLARDTLSEIPNALGGITFEELDEPNGALGPHAFRHALAKVQLMSYGHEKLHETAQILDHSDTTMILEVYASATEVDYDTGESLARSREERGVEVPGRGIGRVA